MSEYGIIILAAGSSSRLGQSKQLLPWGATNLLQHTIDQAEMTTDAVVVVLGAQKEKIAASVKTREESVVYNSGYQEGMASSIVTGLHFLCDRHTSIQAAIFLVCDQPFLSAGHLQKLIYEHGNSGKGIIASAYMETSGVPVLFDKKYFVALNKLTGDDGAKKLLSCFSEDVSVVPFPEGAIDVDTVQDYQALSPEKQ